MRKYIFLALTMLSYSPLHCAERPPQPPKLPTFGQFMQREEERQNKVMRVRLSTLPTELRQDILNRYFFAAYPNLYAMSQRIIAFLDLIAISGLILLLEGLPYTINGIELAETLRSNLPFRFSDKIGSWVSCAKKQVEDGERLFRAVQDGNEKAVEDLLKNKNINLYWRGSNLNQPLGEAVKSQNKEILNRLLLAGSNPEMGGCGSPLEEAVRQGNIEIAKLLLQFGARPEPYMFKMALERGNKELAQRILEAGLNPFCVDEIRYSVRDRALKNNRLDIVEIIDEVLGARRAKQEMK